MAGNGFFTDKFFESPVYKALQAPYNDRMAREAAARNPLAPSQGGPWPSTRPVSTALTPQNYTPNTPPQIPNDPRRATADMRVPGMVGPGQGTMQPFPLAYPDKAPIDITVRGGNMQTAAAPIPLPRPSRGISIQPFDQAENLMDPGNAGYVDPMSGYMPQPAQNPAAGAIAGLSPLTASQRINQPMPGEVAPYNSPRDMSRAQMYDATNAAAADAARTQNRSGTGTDGYVRDASGQVVGRDPKFAGMTPSQMYDQITGRQPAGRTTFSRDMGLERKLAGTGVSADQYVKGLRDGTYSGLGDVRGRPATPVTAGPTQGPARSIAPVSGGIMAPAQRRRAPIMRSA